MPNVRYQALGPLLSGEGSRAFLGLEISDEHRPRPVVLIWAPEEAATNAEVRQKLALETAQAAALVHPNIIRVFGLAAVDEGLARVVEFADGESLRRILDVTRSLPPQFAAFVAAEAAMGVHFAHLTGREDGKPLVHADIRPETVLVSFNGVCKVSGYGALAVAPRELYGKRVKGRRMHSAPEQVIGGRDSATVETDVYLLGILLYECLTGSVPFGEDKNYDLAVVSQPLPRVDYEAIPLGLVDVIGRATAKKALDRYPTALAFREAVERAMGGLPTAEQFSEWLLPHFPEADQARAARRREIEAGIAELSRREWERADPSTLTAPIEDAQPEPLSAPLHQSPVPVAEARPAEGPMPSLRDFARASATHRALSAAEIARAESNARPSSGSSSPPLSVSRDPLTPPPPRVIMPSTPREPPSGVSSPNALASGPAVSAPSAAPAPVAPPPPAAVPSAPPPSSRGSLVGALVGASIAFGVVSVAWAVWQSRRDVVPPAPAASTPVAAASPTVAPAPAPASSAPVAPPPKPADTEAAAAAAAPPPKPKPPPEPPSLELTVTPAVDVSANGKKLGHTPLTVPLEGGKYLLKLSDPVKGINATRTVFVNPYGKTKQSLVLGTGAAKVTAPDGATIHMDGRVVGQAPIGDVPLYEGSHKILVTYGDAKWQQVFNLKPGETMFFNVEQTK